MKKFFVSKSDTNKVNYIKNVISEIKPDNVFILCEKDRENIFTEIQSVKMPLKELNKNKNWLTFVNTFNKNSLLIIDNILKFIFFGDGKKKYLKDISQSINNIIVMDVVPFYTEPAELFYPFWFLGKDILGYNSYNTFKANHLEENEKGNIYSSHSFEILRDKIKDFYIQDYNYFFSNVKFVEFNMNENEITAYNKVKEEASAEFSNPIKLYTDVSESINLIDSRYNATQNCIFMLPNPVIVNNSATFIPKHKKKLGENYSFLTFHDDCNLFNKYNNIIFMQLPVVKPYNIFYIISLNINCIQLNLKGNNLETYFFNKIYNNELRKKFDNLFYNENLQITTK